MRAPRRLATRLGFSLALLVLSCAAAQAVTPLPKFSTWRWSTGADLGSSWRASAFDDSSWPSGPGALGFGDPFIATPIPMGPNATTRYPTAYFRTAFLVNDDPASIASLSLAVNYDDGFVLWLNGVELARRGLGGTVSYGTLAANHEGGAYETIDLTALKSLLVPGTNVLAAEVHQQGLTSSDLAWDAELTYQTGAAAVTRGPYLAMATPQAMTIRWRTNVPTDSRVWLGSSPGALTPATTDPALVTEHELRVSGLSPATRHFYAVGATSGVLTGDDPQTWFDTAPDSATATRVWVLGDSGLPGAAQDHVRDAYYGYAAGRKTDVWLMLGDNAYTAGTDADFQSGVFEPYASFLRTHALWPTRGNHDILYGGANDDYYDLFTMPDAAQAGGVPSLTEAWYSFDHADVHFICLDSEGSDRAPGSAMLTWLQADLQATDRRWIVAFWHHPPYTKGSHDSDDPLDSGGRMRDMRQAAMPILEAGGVDLVLSGHSHSYERSFLLDGHYGVSTTFLPGMKLDPGDGRTGGDGAYEKPVQRSAHAGEVVAVAGSSAQVSGGALDHPAMAFSLNALGSLVLDVHGDSLEGRFLDDVGAVRDSFAIVKETPLIGVGPTAPRLALALAGPNPSRAGAAFRVELPRAGAARLSIVDAAGHVVRRVPLGEALSQRVVTERRGMAPGVYFAVLEFQGERRVARVVFLR
jgi:hypothetical protein